MTALRKSVTKMHAPFLQLPQVKTNKTVIRISSGVSQLFADDYLIEGTPKNMWRRLNRPAKKQEPILVPEGKHEKPSLVFGSIIEDNGNYRLFYKSFQGYPFEEDSKKSNREKHKIGKSPVFVADSNDGFNFLRPKLKNAVIPETNIVFNEELDDFCVMQDTSPDCKKTERYKMLCSADNWWSGLSAAVSPDGVSWKWKKKYAVPFFGDRCSFWYDPIRKKYIAWSRDYQIKELRVIFHAETNTFPEWNFGLTNAKCKCGSRQGIQPKIVVEPDRNDNANEQIYSGYAFMYGGMYFAYLEMFHTQFMRIDTQLACSRDGLRWKRLCDRDIFLPNGEYGDFDAFWAVPTYNPPILKDGKLLIHYNGRSTPHGSDGFEHVKPGQDGCFGVAVLREDGFVSMDTLGTAGELRTKLLSAAPDVNTIEVNCIPFDQRKEAEPMQMDLLIEDKDGNMTECWNIESPADSNPDWFPVFLKKKLPAEFRLVFRQKNARLYSFRLKSKE